MNILRDGGGLSVAEGKQTLRLDKMLSHMGIASRSDIKKMVKQGRITVDDNKVKDSGMQIHPEQNLVKVDGEIVKYQEFVYIMLHKPAGVVSATEDNRDRTVIDLLPEHYRSFEPFPVGRLDKDTEGLLLLTNDGALAHELLSPRKHVPKTYEAVVVGIITEEHVRQFAGGVELDDGYMTKPGKLVIHAAGDGLQSDGQGVLSLHSEAFPEPVSRISLTITEGKFHQVKRMFESVGSKVLYLKRVSMGELQLDNHLPKGAFRELTTEELAQLKQETSR